MKTRPISCMYTIGHVYRLYKYMYVQINIHVKLDKMWHVIQSGMRPLQLNTLFLGPDRPYFQRKLLLVLRSEVGFNYVLSMRNRFFEINLDY